MTVWRVIPEGDIELTASGSVVLLTGAAYVRQKLSTLFRFFLGEWFLDQRQGLPWFRDVFVKDPDINTIRSVFREVIFSVGEIAAIKRMNPVYDAAARLLSFDFEVTLKTGEALIVTPLDADFIIALQEAA